MLDASRYELKIRAIPRGYSLSGGRLGGCEFRVTLQWDDVLWLDATAGSPESLGRIVGDAVRDMAERGEEQLQTYPRERQRA